MKLTISEAAATVVQALQAVYTSVVNQKLVLEHTKPSVTFKWPPSYLGVCIVTKNLASNVSKRTLRKVFRDAASRRNDSMWVTCQGDIDETHCVAYVYRPHERTMYVFDPGSELYGGERDVRALVAVYKKVVPAGKVYQFQSQMQCDCTDTFCQSWSLMFLVCFKSRGNFSFMKSWRHLRPKDKRRKIAKFMLKWINAPVSVMGTTDYRYLMLESWWIELQEQHGLDVYWDYDNKQDLIELARIGFGVKRIRGRKFRYQHESEWAGNMGIWPRPQ